VTVTRYWRDDEEDNEVDREREDETTKRIRIEKMAKIQGTKQR